MFLTNQPLAKADTLINGVHSIAFSLHQLVCGWFQRIQTAVIYQVVFFFYVEINAFNCRLLVEPSHFGPMYEGAFTLCSIIIPKMVVATFIMINGHLPAFFTHTS